MDSSVLRATSLAGPITSQHLFLPIEHQLSPVERCGSGHGFSCLKDAILAIPDRDTPSELVMDVEVMESGKENLALWQQYAQ